MKYALILSSANEQTCPFMSNEVAMYTLIVVKYVLSVNGQVCMQYISYSIPSSLSSFPVFTKGLLQTSFYRWTDFSWNIKILLLGYSILLSLNFIFKLLKTNEKNLQ